VSNSYALYELALARMSATGATAWSSRVVPLAIEHAAGDAERPCASPARTPFGSTWRDPLMLRHDGRARS
jgi:hypothetical protein